MLCKEYHNISTIFFSLNKLILDLTNSICFQQMLFEIQQFFEYKINNLKTFNILQNE